MKNFLLLSALLLLFPFTAYAEGGVVVTKITDNLHLLVSPKGGNVVASTGDDGTFIIDDQLAGRGEIMSTAIKNLNNQDIKFVLNTHYHFDHTGGNEFFGEGGAIILAHDNVRERLSTKQFITYFSREMEPLSKAGLPVVTFASGMTLHYNGDDVRLIHVPAAHTDGDVAVHFAHANVIVAGDTIFNGMYPFIDIEHGGSVKGVIAAQDVLLGLADDNSVIVPGHGALMTKAELQTYRDMLATIVGRIEEAMKAGQTLEQIVATKPTKEFDDKMSGGFIAPDEFVSILHEDLS